MQFCSVVLAESTRRSRCWEVFRWGSFGENRQKHPCLPAWSFSLCEHQGGADSSSVPRTSTRPVQVAPTHQRSVSLARWWPAAHRSNSSPPATWKATSYDPKNEVGPGWCGRGWRRAYWLTVVDGPSSCLSALLHHEMDDSRYEKCNW